MRGRSGAGLQGGAAGLRLAENTVRERVRELFRAADVLSDVLLFTQSKPESVIHPARVLMKNPENPLGPAGRTHVSPRGLVFVDCVLLCSAVCSYLHSVWSPAWQRLLLAGGGA